jgi:hypothetical protein
MQRNAAIFGMNGTIVAEKKISSNESAPTLEALEGAFFRICNVW